MNLSDQSNANVLKQHGAQTEGGLENVYPPVASEAGARAREVALADVDLGDAVDSHRQSLHDSHDGPGVGHQDHPTHALSSGGADRKSTRLNSSHCVTSRMPSSA